MEKFVGSHIYRDGISNSSANYVQYNCEIKDLSHFNAAICGLMVKFLLLKPEFYDT